MVLRFAAMQAYALQIKRPTFNHVCAMATNSGGISVKFPYIHVIAIEGHQIQMAIVYAIVCIEMQTVSRRVLRTHVLLLDAHQPISHPRIRAFVELMMKIAQYTQESWIR
jgi:hypothetical protein